MSQVRSKTGSVITALEISCADLPRFLVTARSNGEGNQNEWLEERYHLVGARWPMKLHIQATRPSGCHLGCTIESFGIFKGKFSGLPVLALLFMKLPSWPYHRQAQIRHRVKVI
jgi:hypothetical protein